MGIQEIVRDAFAKGHLTPAMEGRLAHLCDGPAELEGDEYLALARLQRAVRAGEVLGFRRKHFRNVMDEVVEAAAVRQVLDLEPEQARAVDLGDVIAYALNRLPPLYATSEPGARWQRSRAREELSDLVAERVREAVARSLAHPPPHPDREALRPAPAPDLLRRLAALMEGYGPAVEAAGAP